MYMHGDIIIILAIPPPVFYIDRYLQCTLTKINHINFNPENYISQTAILCYGDLDFIIITSAEM